MKLNKILLSLLIGCVCLCAAGVAFGEEKAYKIDEINDGTYTKTLKKGNCIVLAKTNFPEYPTFSLTSWLQFKIVDSKITAIKPGGESNYRLKLTAAEKQKGAFMVAVHGDKIDDFLKDLTTEHYAEVEERNDGTYVVFSTEPFVTPKAQITVSPTRLDFGNVKKDESATKQLTIKNTGNAPLDNISISSNNMEEFKIGDLSQRINGGESSTIDITFTPQNAEDYTQTITVHSNAGQKLIQLKGKGIIQERETTTGSGNTEKLERTPTTDLPGSIKIVIFLGLISIILLLAILIFMYSLYKKLDRMIETSIWFKEGNTK